MYIKYPKDPTNMKDALDTIRELRTIIVAAKSVVPHGAGVILRAKEIVQLEQQAQKS